MRYNRGESFRYDFQPAINGSFIIKKVNEKEVQASTGELTIVNLSPKGIGIETSYNLPDPKTYEVTLQIVSTLNEKTLTFTGEILWKKSSSKGFSYGLELNTTEAIQNEIIATLKKYAVSQSSL